MRALITKRILTLRVAQVLNRRRGICFLSFSLTIKALNHVIFFCVLFRAESLLDCGLALVPHKQHLLFHQNPLNLCFILLTTINRLSRRALIIAWRYQRSLLVGDVMDLGPLIGKCIQSIHTFRVRKLVIYLVGCYGVCHEVDCKHSIRVRV